MSDRNWPAHMWKKDADGQILKEYAHGPKELKALQESGWSDDGRSMPITEYPRLVYRANGEYTLCNNADHELELAEDGYGREPMKPKTVNGSAAAHKTEDGGGSGRIDELERGQDEIRQSVESLQSGLNQIMSMLKGQAEAEPAAKRGRGRPPAASAA